MNKYIEVARARNKLARENKRKSELLEKTIENIVCERAGKPPIHDDAKIYEELMQIAESKNVITAELSDESALIDVTVFDEWNPNFAYVSGDRFTYNGNLYRVKKPNAVNPTWTPDVTHEFYEPVALPTEDGTLDNPITAVAGMSYEKGKYYAEGDKVYLCTRSDTLHHLPSALVGHYFEEVGETNG